MTSMITTTTTTIPITLIIITLVMIIITITYVWYSSRAITKLHLRLCYQLIIFIMIIVVISPDR